MRTRGALVLQLVQQLEPDEVGALGVEGGLDQIGRDRDLLACGGRTAARAGAGPAAAAGTSPGDRRRRRGRRRTAPVTRAGGGPNIDGWPLCRFHDSQMKNSEARKMPQSRVRRMSVMAASREDAAAHAGAAKQGAEEAGRRGGHRVEDRRRTTDGSGRCGHARAGHPAAAPCRVDRFDRIGRARRLERQALPSQGLSAKPIAAHERDQASRCGQGLMASAPRPAAAASKASSSARGAAPQRQRCGARETAAVEGRAQANNPQARGRARDDARPPRRSGA